MSDSLDFILFFFNDTATTEIYTLSLHDALPIFAEGDSARWVDVSDRYEDQKRAGHEHGGEHQRAGMEDDRVEGDDVEVAREAQEVVVLGLGVHAAELVAGGQKRQCGQNYPRVALRQVPFAPEQIG